MTQERDKPSDNCGSRGAHALCKQLPPGAECRRSAAPEPSAPAGELARPWGAPRGRKDSGHLPCGALQLLTPPPPARLSGRAAAAAAAGSWIYFHADISLPGCISSARLRAWPLDSCKSPSQAAPSRFPRELRGREAPGCPRAAHKSTPEDSNRTWCSRGTSRFRARGIGLLGKQRKTRRGFVKNDRGMGIDAQRGFQHLITSLSEHSAPGQVNPPNPALKIQGKFPLGLTFPRVNSIYCCLREVQLP